MIVIWVAILGAALWLATGELLTAENLVLLAIGGLVGIYMRKAEPAGFSRIVGFGLGMVLLIAAASGRLEPVAAAADIEHRTLVGAASLAGIAVVAFSLIAYVASWGERDG